jgi:DNA-binding CsgD family transcriptional regulator
VIERFFTCCFKIDGTCVRALPALPDAATCCNAGALEIGHLTPLCDTFGSMEEAFQHVALGGDDVTLDVVYNRTSTPMPYRMRFTQPINCCPDFADLTSLCLALDESWLRLSKREKEVVRAVHRHDQAAARELGISPATVRSHVQRIKLKASLRSQADWYKFMALHA